MPGKGKQRSKVGGVRLHSRESQAGWVLLDPDIRWEWWREAGLTVRDRWGGLGCHFAV